MRFPYLAASVLIAGAVLHLALTLYAAALETPVVDEFAHVPAGVSYWRHGAWSLYSKNPPAVKLWMTLPLVFSVESPPVDVEPFRWGPWLYGMNFEKQNGANYLRAFVTARIMIIILSLATGFLIFLWARPITGEVAAALAALGFWMAPTVLAHAHLATIDIGATLTIFALCFCLFRLKDTWPSLITTGVVLGLALASKFTALFLLPWYLWVVRSRPKILLVTGLTALFILHLTFGFSQPFAFIGDLNLHSHILNRLPGWLPAIIPRDYIVGLDAQIGDAEGGEFGNYLLGEWSRGGWWYYNLVALALKEHPLTLALLAMSPFLLWRRRRKDLLPILIPIMCIGLPMAFFNPLQVGVRYLLPLFPFFFLLIALAHSRRVLGAVAVAWVFTALVSAPDYLSYFNFIALQLGSKPELLLDSNLDWGQDLYRLKGINAEAGGPIGLMYFGHVLPSLYGIEYQLIPDHKVRGLLAVSANLLQGMPYPVTAPDGTLVSIDTGHLRWLRAFKPVRTEGSILIFDTRRAE